MNLDSEMTQGGAAGVRTLVDVGLWLRLARGALSPLVLLQVAIACVLLVVMAVLAAGIFPVWLLWLIPLGFAIWLWPPVLRWFISAVSMAALHSVADEEGLVPQELPPVRSYRAWWRPVLVCSLVLAPLSQIGLATDPLCLLALSVALVWFATPAVIRSVLAPWFPPDRIESALETDRSRWTILTAFWFVAFVLLHWILLQATGFGTLDLVAGATAAWRNSQVALFVVGHLLSLAVLTMAVGIFCTAAIARMAAERLHGAPDAPPRSGSPLEFDLLRESALRAAGSTRGMGIAVAVALAIALLWPHVRKPVVLALLHVDDTYAQPSRNQFACDGKTFKLRMLHWGGIDSTGTDRDTALACAAKNGQLSTVKLLVSLGDAVTAPVSDPRFDSTDTRLSPIAQALQSAKGLPSVEYLLAQGNGASLQRSDAGGPDGTQAAALSDCMACVEWAIRHHAPIDGTWQATPMALWLDGAGRGTHEEANLQRLQSLGLSATAIGDDGRSALHAAANNGDLDAVNWLLAQGADPAQADRDGYTPLLYAANHLGRGPNNRRIDRDAESDLERVRVVQRLMAVTPTVERHAQMPVRHVLLSALSPYASNPIGFEYSIAAYPALQEQAGVSLADLIEPSAQ